MRHALTLRVRYQVRNRGHRRPRSGSGCLGKMLPCCRSIHPDVPRPSDEYMARLRMRKEAGAMAAAGRVERASGGLAGNAPVLSAEEMAFATSLVNEGQGHLFGKKHRTSLGTFELNLGYS